MEPSLHLMAKPCGPACNLDCTYCFYLERAGQGFRTSAMPEEVLEAYIRTCIRSARGPEVPFVWQGGEPLLAGMDFYRRALALQARHGDGRPITNAIQTNGLLLDEAWCAFLKAHGFTLGISLDGPQAIHDTYRRDRWGQGTFARVMGALERVRRQGIPFNILACVSAASAGQGAEVYEFLVREGVRHLQFSPVVERMPDAEEAARGCRHGSPSSLAAEAVRLAPWSVPQGRYGEFLCAIYDRWVRRDVGTVFVQNFEWALSAWLGLPSTVCVFAERCGQSMVVEADGGVYACDHYAYPAFRLGSILEQGGDELRAEEARQGFGEAKANLPGQCLTCQVRFACRGECPRHRFCRTAEGEPGLNYLCEDYRQYFRHLHPGMKVMAQLIRLGKPASLVMDAFEGPLRVEV